MQEENYMIDFKKQVIYQIYPKSFKDSNNDGVGDLKGIIEKLDYIKSLGVDCIWLTPIYKSPQKDNGYDVADYTNIDEIYGTMEDFDELILQCKNRGIFIMLDMVFNHTSSEHIWFKKALENNPKYKDYYIFKEGKDSKPPTNWVSKFGGSAWEKLEGTCEYYLHLFDVTQPDLNWENRDVVKEIYSIMDFWLEKGIRGFRFDVINLISKPEVYEDDNIGDGRRFYTDARNVHKHLKDLNKNTFGKYDTVTVGEMSSTNVQNCIRYSDPNEKELSMTFSFHHLKVDYKDGDKWSLMDFDFLKLKEILNHWQVEMEKGDGWNALFWCNHDQPRIVSRFGNDEKYHKESAKMLATTIHLMRGTPFIYQGEEIGMTNNYFNSISEYRDVESLNYYKILKDNNKDEKDILNILGAKSRDNSRTPMQWNMSKNSGFSVGNPWINVAKNYKQINTELAIEDKNSIFYHYKKLIDLRKKHDIIAYGTYIPILKEDLNVFAYIRSYQGCNLLVINNFYDKDIVLNIKKHNDFKNNNWELFISNYNDILIKENIISLRPYESFAIKY